LFKGGVGPGACRKEKYGGDLPLTEHPEETEKRVRRHPGEKNNSRNSSKGKRAKTGDGGPTEPNQGGGVGGYERKGRKFRKCRVANAVKGRQNKGCLRKKEMFTTSGSPNEVKRKEKTPRAAHEEDSSLRLDLCTVELK